MRQDDKSRVRPGRFSRFARIAALATILLARMGQGEAVAGQVALAWDANPEPDIAGYKLYYGTVSGSYGAPIDVGNVTTHTVPNLTDGLTYFFATTAYDAFGNQSGYSNEVTFTVPGVVEMDLLGNGVPIADGDSTPTVLDHTDFGGTRLTGGTVTRTFTIRNTGSGLLILPGTPRVAVGGANAADFTVTVQPADSVAAGGATTFLVRFDPSAAGTREASISIANNDANENPYDFAIRGRGVAPPAAPTNLRVAP